MYLKKNLTLFVTSFLFFPLFLFLFIYFCFLIFFFSFLLPSSHILRTKRNKMSTPERAQSDFKKLKSKYNSQLSTLKELFTEWTEEDLLFTLQDADGDLELAIDRISEGKRLFKIQD